MAHLRVRFAASQVKKLASLWPIVAVVGARQVGKTTFLERHFKFASNAALDHDATRADAENSAVSFVSRLPSPALIDEIQKVPKLFDALKLAVHRERRPGRFFITGSTSFSEGAGIRESLTGRVGTCQLHPLTLAEALEREWGGPISLRSLRDGQVPRISLEQFSQGMVRGGLPVPMFLRDRSQSDLYWDGWLTTGVIRDLARLLGRGFEADFAFSLLDQIGKALREGELPTTSHLAVGGGRSPRKATRYLQALENLFLLRRVPCHELGVGKDAWLPFDAGLAGYLMKDRRGEGATLSLARITLLNEISAQNEYSGRRFFARYFKSAKGTPVDLVLNLDDETIPARVVPLAEVGRGPWGWHEKPLLGAMKKLSAQRGILWAPLDRAHLPKKPGVMLLPWSVWS